MGCAIGPSRVSRPGIAGRVESGEFRGRTGERRRRTWLIDVTELDEAKEGAVTKVDFAAAPPRIGPSDYRDDNELTTEAGSRRHDADHYPWQILRYDVDFFFPPAPLAAPLSISSILSYHFASVEAAALGRENEFSLGNRFLCGTDAKVRPLARPVSHASRRIAGRAFLWYTLETRDFVPKTVRLSFTKRTAVA